MHHRSNPERTHPSIKGRSHDILKGQKAGNSLFKKAITAKRLQRTMVHPATNNGVVSLCVVPSVGGFRDAFLKLCLLRTKARAAGLLTRQLSISCCFVADLRPVSSHLICVLTYNLGMKNSLRSATRTSKLRVQVLQPLLFWRKSCLDILCGETEALYEPVME